jgi:hypothetical protein
MPIGDSRVRGAQRGGTCGLYSLWYATILLGIVNPQDKRPPILPRRYLGATGQSSRNFSKTIGSGQGELLNAQEIFAVITHYGYQCDVENSADEMKRKRFISDSLSKNRPILFAYMEGGAPGESCYPAATCNPNKPEDFGPHWGLLIVDAVATYGIVDPHWPNTIRHYGWQQVLKANALTDSGAPFPDTFKSPERTGPKGEGFKANTYNLNNPSQRQLLKNLLISVY